VGQPSSQSFVQGFHFFPELTALHVLHAPLSNFFFVSEQTHGARAALALLPAPQEATQVPSYFPK